jgi:hypothetical protein
MLYRRHKPCHDPKATCSGNKHFCVPFVLVLLHSENNSRHTRRFQIQGEFDTSISSVYTV